NLPTLTANGLSEMAPVHAMSDDGHFTVFISTAINVVAGQVDTNKTADVFLFDKTAGTNTLVSHVPGSLATTGNGLSSNAVISGDGKTIVFYTLATNLGSTATAGVQVYLYDNDSSSATYQQLKLISHTPGSTTTAGNGTSPV